MKKLLLSVVCLAFMAAPAFAQDETDVYAPSGPGNGSMQQDLHRKHNNNGGGTVDRPVAPVPEPGTMALASMGLLALGAAARKRASQ